MGMVMSRPLGSSLLIGTKRRLIDAFHVKENVAIIDLHQIMKDGSQWFGDRVSQARDPSLTLNFIRFVGG